MSLQLSVLRSGLRPLFDPATMPTSAADAIVRWAQAYIPYASAAVAGGAVPALLSPVPAGGPFYQALDDSFRTMWMATPWTGPGLVGTTAAVPSLAPLLEANRARLVQSRDPELALSLIADALHTYTLSITVSVVPPSGTPAIVPLT